MIMVEVEPQFITELDMHYKYLEIYVKLCHHIVYVEENKKSFRFSAPELQNKFHSELHYSL